MSPLKSKYSKYLESILIFHADNFWNDSQIVHPVVWGFISIYGYKKQNLLEETMGEGSYGIQTPRLYIVIYFFSLFGSTFSRADNFGQTLFCQDEGTGARYLLRSYKTAMKLNNEKIKREDQRRNYRRNKGYMNQCK